METKSTEVPIEIDTEVNQARTWDGSEVRCDACAHRALLAESRCRLRMACVEDRYARRIDRFFEWNPELANAGLDHPYFEVRAVAAKYADPGQLPRLLDDPDETVRWSAALRLPEAFLMRLTRDPHREVRIRVAARLDPADLLLMMKDSDYYVRQIVARRLPGHLLKLMVRDGEPEVRRIVASRIEPAWIGPLTRDPDDAVRLEAVQRLLPHQLAEFDCDRDWRVRYEVARRMSIRLVGVMLRDSDPMVREVAAARLEEAKVAPRAGAAQERA